MRCVVNDSKEVLQNVLAKQIYSNTETFYNFNG